MKHLSTLFAVILLASCQQNPNTESTERNEGSYEELPDFIHTKEVKMWVKDVLIGDYVQAHSQDLMPTLLDGLDSVYYSPGSWAVYKFEDGSYRPSSVQLQHEKNVTLQIGHFKMTAATTVAEIEEHFPNSFANRGYYTDSGGDPNGHFNMSIADHEDGYILMRWKDGVCYDVVMSYPDKTPTMRGESAESL